MRLNNNNNNNSSSSVTILIGQFLRVSSVARRMCVWLTLLQHAWCSRTTCNNLASVVCTWQLPLRCQPFRLYIIIIILLLILMVLIIGSRHCNKLFFVLYSFRHTIFTIFSRIFFVFIISINRSWLLSSIEMTTALSYAWTQLCCHSSATLVGWYS